MGPWRKLDIEWTYYWFQMVTVDAGPFALRFQLVQKKILSLLILFGNGTHQPSAELQLSEVSHKVGQRLDGNVLTVS